MSHAGPPPPPPPPTPPPPPPPPPGGGQPPYLPPPAAPKSRILLWVVLGVVLAVVAAGAVTLVLVAPWEEESPTRDAGRDDEGEDEGEGESEGESESEQPSAEPPAVVDRVTGDRDGDGLGDAQFVLSEEYGVTYERWTFTNTGSGFDAADEAEEWQPGAGQGFADWDGDGQPGVVSLKDPVDAGDSITFTLTGDEIDDKDVELPVHPESPKHAPAMVGDYDGDDRPDVAVLTQTASCEVTVSVLLGTGTGFGDPSTWAVLAETLITQTRLTPADLDGDGDTDLVGVVPADPPTAGQCESGAWGGDYAGVVLTSSGSAFDAGDETDIADDDLSELVGGDFSGDGTPMLAVSDYGTSIRFLRYDGSGMVDVPDQAVDLGPDLEAASTHDGTSDFGIEALSVADVDGDGDDDLVVLAHDERADFYYAGVWVVRSEGTSFAAPEKWAEASDCGEFDSCIGKAATGTVFN